MQEATKANPYVYADDDPSGASCSGVTKAVQSPSGGTNYYYNSCDTEAIQNNLNALGWVLGLAGGASALFAPPPLNIIGGLIFIMAIVAEFWNWEIGQVKTSGGDNGVIFYTAGTGAGTTIYNLTSQ